MSDRPSEGGTPKIDRRGASKEIAAAAVVGFAAGAAVASAVTRELVKSHSETEREKLKRKCISELTALRAKLEQEKNKAKQLEKGPEEKEAQAEMLKALQGRIKELEAEVRRLEREWRALPPPRPRNI